MKRMKERWVLVRIRCWSPIYIWILDGNNGACEAPQPSKPKEEVWPVMGRHLYSSVDSRRNWQNAACIGPISLVTMRNRLIVSIKKGEEGNHMKFSSNSGRMAKAAYDPFLWLSEHWCCTPYEEGDIHAVPVASRCLTTELCS